MKTDHKEWKITKIEKLKVGEFILINPKDLDFDAIPEIRPLISKIIDIDHDEEYVTGEWWTMVRLD